MLYIVETFVYDCFVGEKTYKEEFNTLLEAWSYYRYRKSTNKRYDDIYLDHIEETKKPRLVWSPKKETQPKHGRGLGYAPSKEDILLPTLEEGVFGIFTDVKDITPSGLEEEYFFDTDDIEF